MATNLDLVSHKKTGLNSGYDKAHFDFTKITGIVLIPKDVTFDVAYGATALSTQLANAGIASDINDRIFALPQVVGYTDSSTEDKKQTFGYGGEHYSSYGTYQGMFEFSDAKKALQKVLTRYNKLQNVFNLLMIDENGFILCRKATDTTITGFTLASIWTPKWKFSGADGTKCELFISFANAVELNADLHILETDFDVLSKIGNVTDVTLTAASALTTRVVSVFVNAGDGESSLLDDYADALDDTTAFTGTVVSSGVSLTVSSITQTTINNQKALTITFGSSGYPSSGATIAVKGSAMSVWTGLGVVGFENREALTLTV